MDRPTEGVVTVELTHDASLLARGHSPYVWLVRLPVFQGPLALLLYLVRQQKLNIYDIPIALLTDQYMAYLSILRECRLEVAVEFLAMAAHLLWLKSRTLLPPDPTDRPEADPADEDPRQPLVRRLLDYEALRKAARWLQHRWRLQRRLSRPVRPGRASSAGDGPPPSRVDAWADPTEVLVRLGQAMAELVRRRRYREPVVLRVHLPRIEDYMADLLRTVRRRTTFQEYLRRCPSRAEQGVAFLALLQLAVQGKMAVEQTEPFGPIFIEVVRRGGKSIRRKDP
ncbi:Segregation and condensation protein A [bacterium HR11]|nr:Segregation and condensation protein A [bacterium HR11]